MTAVGEHHCGGWIYELVGPDGTLLLDPNPVDGGPWMPLPDGRHVEQSVEEWGYREHRCVPEGQGELL